MILPVAVLLLALSVPLTGGSLRGLAEVRLERTWVILAALGLQLVLTVGVTPPDVGATLHLVSYAIAGTFVLVNRRVPGLVVTASGGALNLAAIAANGGVMPASPRALELAGIAATPERFANSAALEGARLSWLGDVFAIPDPWPLANVFSVGDVVLAIGIGIVFHSAGRRVRSSEPVPVG